MLSSGHKWLGKLDLFVKRTVVVFSNEGKKAEVQFKKNDIWFYSDWFKTTACRLFWSADGENRKPSELWNLENKHPSVKDKPEDIFVRKLEPLKNQEDCITQTGNVNTNALQPPYLVSLWILQNCKVQTIAESTILPSVTDVVSKVIRPGAVITISRAEPLSDNMVSPYIGEMAKDVQNQLLSKFTKVSTLQFN